MRLFSSGSDLCLDMGIRHSLRQGAEPGAGLKMQSGAGVARRTHNPEVVVSNPTSAPNGW